MAKTPKARHSNGDATLADLVHRYVDAGGARDDLASYLYAAEEVELAENVGGTRDELVGRLMDTFQQSPSMTIGSVCGSLLRLREVGKARELVDMPLEEGRTPDAAAHGVLFAECIRGGRMDEGLELLRRVEPDSVFPALVAARDALGALPLETARQVVELAPEDGRGNLIGSQLPASLAAQLLEEAPFLVEEKVELCLKAGLREAADALLPSIPDTCGSALSWNALSLRLGRVSIDDATGFVSALRPDDRLFVIRYTLDLAAQLVALGDASGLEAVLALVEDVHTLESSSYDLPGARIRHHLLQAQLGQLAGLPKQVSLALKNARLVDKDYLKLSRIVAAEIEMDLPHEAYRSVMKMPAAKRYASWTQVAVAYVPDLAAALMILDRKDARWAPDGLRVIRGSLEHAASTENTV
ncbi:MAG: hypothetical protein KUG77_07050 [Nannocystaceae bacterium]|nr:hypothetical protein [Nannocystaceae bacterium]